MAPTPNAPSRIETPTGAGEHSHRREKLYEARKFRLEQLASLEEDLAGAPHEHVKTALHMAATTALAEIDAALDRMARGVYGRCVTCHGPIDKERLDVLPMTAQCMPCHFNEQNLRFTRSG